MENSIHNKSPNTEGLHANRPQLSPHFQEKKTVHREIVVTQRALSQALFRAGLGLTMAHDVTNQIFTQSVVPTTNDRALFLSRETSVSSFQSLETSFLTPISENTYIGHSASFEFEAPAVRIPADLLSELDMQIESLITQHSTDETLAETGRKLKVFLQTATLPSKTFVLRCLKGQVPDFNSPLLVQELDQLLTDFLFSSFDDESTVSAS